MSKRPQLRKRASSSSSSSCDDDSAKGPTRGPRQGRGVQPKRATLSFGNEDEADSDERPFAVKKSKASRIIKKKMRQAPNAASVVDSVALSERSDASVGGNYSAESLAALRGMQRFSTAPPPAAQELEGPEIVLAGDEAQRAEDDLAVEEDSNGDRALRDKINKLKEERNGDGKKKVKFTNAIPRADDRDFNAVDDQDSATWEEELLKRAGSATRPIGSTLPFQKESRPLKNAEEITFKDFLLSLHGGIEKLNLSLSANCTKLSAVNDECSEAAKEDVAMKSKVELMNEMQGWMEVRYLHTRHLHCFDRLNARGHYRRISGFTAQT